MLSQLKLEALQYKSEYHKTMGIVFSSPFGGRVLQFLLSDSELSVLLEYKFALAIVLAFIGYHLANHGLKLFNEAVERYSDFRE